TLLLLSTKPKPQSTLFPYTTLFRSRNKKVHGTSIEDRPKSVEERKEFGHWEIDTVIGKKNADEPVLLTLVERKTTFELIFKIDRSEEHTSELQSRFDLVCRLLLEKK